MKVRFGSALREKKKNQAVEMITHNIWGKKTDSWRKQGGNNDQMDGEKYIKISRT